MQVYGYVNVCLHFYLYIHFLKTDMPIQYDSVAMRLLLLSFSLSIRTSLARHAEATMCMRTCDVSLCEPWSQLASNFNVFRIIYSLYSVQLGRQKGCFRSLLSCARLLQVQVPNPDMVKQKTFHRDKTAPPINSMSSQIQILCCLCSGSWWHSTTQIAFERTLRCYTPCFQNTCQRPSSCFALFAY